MPDATGALQFDPEQRHAQRGPALPSTTQHALKTAMTPPGTDPQEWESQFTAVAKLRSAEIPARDAPLPYAGAFVSARRRLLLRLPLRCQCANPFNLGLGRPTLN